MPPREWDAWRVWRRVRPRPDVLMAAAVVCCGFERIMLGGEPKVEDYYPVVERVRRRKADAPDRVESALDRAFGV